MAPKTHARKVGPISRKRDDDNAPTYELTEAQVLEAVSGDKRRASDALRAENKHDAPRSTLVAQLERISAEADAAPIGTASPPEAEAPSAAGDQSNRARRE